ncbi:pyruvate kinase [Tistrella bauzanensis]|uniref:Pyruvate kinase n=1 Tax=Tistrella bauzanensis TaxID=657419 RepID=A0ABQ1I9X6_9PROT|nr:pyruvate kinase [Tistrella bauzanensis]GGB31006.1 pyruvate kinase [Tistrella bauzanensis]
MRRYRRAKIVATIGPASADPAMLKVLFLAGVDTFRLNFSHGSHDDHARVHASIRTLEAEAGRPIGILQDLQGPKIRVGTIRDGRITVTAGQAVSFVPEGTDGDAGAIPLPHPEIFAAVMPGHHLLIDDGRVDLRVTGVDDQRIAAEVITGGVISNRKGVNLPGTVLDLSPLTPKDRADLAFGLALGVDWVALSFVQKPGDLIEAHGLIKGQAGLVAKVEKPSALDHLDDIVRLADAVMVARGDLGVEIPHEEVPGRQKEIVRACRMAAKPVIVATQMLDSMVHAPTPTRAEASDVATAIYDGADAVMLSAESAAGDYPVEAVEMMDRIIRRTEQHKYYRAIIDASGPGEERTAPHAIASAAADLAAAIGAPVIVAFTSSGTTAARIARKRPAMQILAITPDQAVSRRLCLVWGVHAIRSEDIHTYEDMVSRATAIAVAEDFAAPPAEILVVAGIPFAQAGTTNNLRVVQIDGR